MKDGRIIPPVRAFINDEDAASFAVSVAASKCWVGLEIVQEQLEIIDSYEDSSGYSVNLVWIDVSEKDGK